MRNFTYYILTIITLILLGCKPNESSKNTATTNVFEIENNTRLDNEFIINGSVFNAENKTVYLYKSTELAYSVIDSARVINNKFLFKGIVKTPIMYAVSKGNNKSKFPFLVDNSSIDLFINSRLANSNSYSPTQLQKDYLLYTSKTAGFKDKGMRLYYNMRGDFSDKNIIALKQKRNALFNEENKFVSKFISAHPNSYYSAIIIKSRLNAYGYKSNRLLFKTLSNTTKKLPIGVYIDSFLTVKENKKQVVNVKAPKNDNIKPVTNTPTSEENYRPKAYKIDGYNQFGEVLSLNTIPKGNVILVDFWASWCGPCRASNPTLVNLYNKYNNQGFEIISISEDKAEAEWINAIAEDNLLWDYHIIDKNKTIAFRYGVGSIPFKLLIDKNGNIASDKISGSALENKIKALLAE